MVKKRSMALDHWFPVTLALGGTTSSQSTPQQITLAVPKK